jgi:membrane-bound lytic murein transglycosylase A
MRRLAAAGLSALILAGCASQPPPGPAGPAPVGPGPAPAPNPTPIPPPPAPIAPPDSALPPAPYVSRTDFRGPPGWDSEDHAAALSAFVAGCGVSKDPSLAAVCRRAKALSPAALRDRRLARDFLESNFQARELSGEGLLTAYFAPQYEARISRQGEFTAALRGKPDDLAVLDLTPFDVSLKGKTITGRMGARTFEPYPDRAAIEATPVDRPLGWLRPEDLFFLQIQGSGVLMLPDGRKLKATYAANNGLPFVGIAAPMRSRGLLADNNTSGEAIRGWLAANRGTAADNIMRLNPRYVFFQTAPDDGIEPAGAAGVPLPAGRAIAVDPSRYAYGGLYWIDGRAPALAGAFPTYRRAVMVLDTGGAIRGDNRADLYLGSGDAAGREAGRVRHTLKLWRLEPR